MAYMHVFGDVWAWEINQHGLFLFTTPNCFHVLHCFDTIYFAMDEMIFEEYI